MTGKQILAVVVGIALAATAAVGGYFYLHGDSKKATPPEPASTDNTNGTAAQQAPEEMEPNQRIIWSYSGTYLRTSNSYGFEGADKSCPFNLGSQVGKKKGRTAVAARPSQSSEGGKS